MPAINFRKLPKGTPIGPYTVGETVGSGAFATVYAATLPDGTRRALKIRRAGEASHDRRFLREFESMRALRVPGVVRVYDAGQDADLLWFAMDLVDGLHFDEVVRRLPTPRARARLAARLGLQVLQTLAALHQRGIVHRDVKPSNILVDAEDRVHVLDFGIVRFFGEVPGHQTTNVGEIIGTVPFMAPEQLAGLPMDEKVDIFACGILLYEAVAGRRERPKNPLAWIPRTCLERPIPLAARFREVSRGLSHAIECMLTVDPEARPTADAAVRQLRLEDAGKPSIEWPEPPFVSPGDWFEQLLGCIGDKRNAHVQIVEGPAGSGKRRLAEQVHREGLVQGVWTVHTACRRDRIGAPIGQLIRQMVRTGRSDDRSRDAFGPKADALRQMWPHTGIPNEPESGGQPSPTDVATALAHVLQRLVSGRPTLWVVTAIEDCDPYTSAAIIAVAQCASPRLGVLLLHDPRWASDTSRALIDTAEKNGAKRHAVEYISADIAAEIAKGIAPEAPTRGLARCRPQHAVERGLLSLSEWRDETFAPPATRLWPLVVLSDAVPDEVVRRLSGASALGDTHVARHREHSQLPGRMAVTAVRARLADRKGAAQNLLRTWRGVGSVPDSVQVHLRLLSDDPNRAFPAAARAAIEAEHLGRYADAREMLFLLDTLPRPTHLPQAGAFALARVRARTFLRTEPTPPRQALVDDVAVHATSPAQEADYRLIVAEYALRRGQTETAVVAALRVAAGAATVAPAVAVRALLVATQTRASSGRLAEVERDLSRAEDILRRHPDAMLAVQTQSWRAELALRTQDLGLARDLSLQTLKDANTFGYVRGRAFNAARLGQILRAAGRRREAEHYLRDALDAFAVTGDIALHAEVRLILATLVAERGDAVAARYLLDEALRRVRQLHIQRLIPVGLRVALVVASQVGDANDASMALESLQGNGIDDNEAPAAIARWWRTRGDLQRASDIEAPGQHGYGHMLWRIEGARVALAGGDIDRTIQLATSIRDDAKNAGFREISLYATLILGGAGDIDETWEERQARATESLNIDVYLGAIEMEARRRHLAGDALGARAAWRSLALRSADLSYAPGLEEAEGWL